MGAFPSYRLLVVLIMIFLSDVGPAMSCLESERQALLAFKGGLVDESNRLGSWVDVSCCDWYGVSCNNSTGHVTGLHLQPDELYLSYEAYNRSRLRGTISPSLIHLKQLVHLNLSYNDFGGTRIPPFLGLMTSLQQLDLSHAGFGGRIPSQIGNLTNLDYLGLGFNSRLSSDSMQWVSSLSLLHHLDLSLADLSKAGDWLHSINAIPSLSELILSDCGLDPFLSVPLLNNLSSLAVLDLSDCNLQEGPIPDGLQNLSSLRSLDLSGNNFNSSIPSWLYGFSSGLEILHLEDNILQGVISSAIGNLTSLSYLELGGFNGDLEIGGRETIKSMGQLCRLKHLGLSGVKVNQDVVDIFRDLSSSSSCPPNGLEGIYLDSAGIFGNLNKVSFQRFKSLVSLSLPNNAISGSIPQSFGELRYLEEADLGGNSMVGSVSETHFAKLVGLKYFWAGGNKLELKVSPNWIPPFQLVLLDLSSWQLGKEFPPWLHSQNNIGDLLLSGCGIEGTIPEWLGKMWPQLGNIDLSNNQLKGEVPVIFSSYLRYLDLSNNSFESISKGFWNFSGTLSNLKLSDNQIVGEIPCGHLMTFSDYGTVDLSSNKFHGLLPPFSSNLIALDVSGNSFESISKGFWNFSRSLTELNLSYNQIVGEIPSGGTLEFMDEYGVVDLSSNKFQGRIPPFSSKLAALDLSSNSFTDSLSHFLCHQMNRTKQMQVLNLANNFLSGEIPDCWVPWNRLSALRLSENNFTGRIPSSMKNLRALESLHLRNNKLSGEGLHLLLRSCQKLVVLDSSENQLQGEIPSWIGMPSLTILNLRSNRFHGKLPQDICALTALHVIDLANNNLSGPIPPCINQLGAMTTNDSMGSQISKPEASLQVGGYLEDAILVIQGRVMEYNTTLNLVKTMDFSNNFFTGKIPDEVTALAALRSLNLSRNMLTGAIPQNIGAMTLLESLDLSVNMLVGEIPSSTSSLYFLNHLNLSGNNLTGPIPSGTQLQSFDASCFAGNDLCGSPLPNSCGENEAKPPATDTHGGTGDTFLDDEWFYVSVGFGFVIGFWGFMFHLLCNRQWRIAFFSFLDKCVIFILEFVSG